MANEKFKSELSAAGSLISKIKIYFPSLTELALDKAWSLADMAAQFEDQKAILNSLAGQYATTASQIINNIQNISTQSMAVGDALNILTEGENYGRDKNLRQRRKASDMV